MPGAGGTQRMPRLMGAMAALPLMLEGKHDSARDAALKGGLVHKVVPAADLITEAKALDQGRRARPCSPGTRRTTDSRAATPTIRPPRRCSWPATPCCSKDHAATIRRPKPSCRAVYRRRAGADRHGAAHRGALPDQGHDASRVATNMIRSLFFNMQKAIKLAAPAQGRAEDEARRRSACWAPA